MSTFLLPKRESANSEKRDVKKVPFVELQGGRLQGVVSSGSDIKRVYVSYIEARSLQYYCSTNNNRPCGGLRGSPCKHLQTLVQEAVAQFGLPAVINFLQPPQKEVDSPSGLLQQATGVVKDPAGIVFARFLAYLQQVEQPPLNRPLPELDWFVP